MVDVLSLILLTLIAATVGTMTGFGTSTIMVPTLSLFLPLPQTLLFVGILHWFGDIWKMVFFKKGFNLKLILLFGIPGTIFSFLAAKLPLTLTKVTPGYTGSSRNNPNYESVSMGTTGHAEAIQIEFDPKTISYADLLHVFFATHDPTTLNQQGADVGSQYRSAIFYHDEEQKKLAEKAIREAQKDYPSKIVTELQPFTKFSAAEKYHRDFYRKNQGSPYCRIVIDPKIQKLKAKFKPFLKNN